jgi:ubiquinone/menaquinone biosynthesis C-methylase UbiE
MPDAIFADPRLAPLYDRFNADRSDLDAYVAIVAEFKARRILDLGCGTGVLALLLAEHGREVIGVDPAAASLDVARSKPGADKVRFILGDATTLPPLHVDLVTMTGNVAQVFLTDAEWMATLIGIRQALRPGGRLVFESRDPARRAWEEWIRDWSPKRVELAGVGVVESWAEVTRVDGALVTFAGATTLPDGAVVPTSSTLRFREREEFEATLTAAGFTVDDVRDAPDRPGHEFVFIASRRDGHAGV